MKTMNQSLRRCAGEFTLWASMALAWSCGSPVRPAMDDQSDATAIRGQITRYTAALDAADVNLASEVWNAAADVSLIHPAGHAHGWKEVKQIYESFASTFSERTLTARDLSVHIAGDAAWVEFYWHFVGKQQKGGATIQTDGRETQIYNRIGGRWRLVHVHYSGPATTQ